MLSVVPFLDDDFHDAQLAPFAKFRFGQANHRVYVIEQATGKHAAWFFGTTLGSWLRRLAIVPCCQDSRPVPSAELIPHYVFDLRPYSCCQNRGAAWIEPPQRPLPDVDAPSDRTTGCAVRSDCRA